jgi:hypothetical protein
LSPEALFARILEPKPAAAAPKASVRFVAGEGHYVVVDGRPVARYESRPDAEACAHNW